MISKPTNENYLKSPNRKFTDDVSVKPRFEGHIRKRPERHIRKLKGPETIKIIRSGAPQRPVAKPTILATKTLDSVAPQIAAAIPEPSDVNSTLSSHSFAEIFPVPDEGHRQSLANDIAARGLLEEIVVYEGKILDGRSRYLACIQVGVTPRFRQYDGKDPLGFVISRNVHRRHLTKNQRVLAAARAATLPVGSNQSTPGLPIGRAAEVFNVSERNIARAKAILRHGTVELVRAVESGKIAVSRAAKLCELAVEAQTARLQEIVGRKRNPQKKKEPPAVNENTSVGQIDEALPTKRSPSADSCDSGDPEFHDKRDAGGADQENETTYAHLMAAWSHAPNSVRIRFIEALMQE